MRRPPFRIKANDGGRLMHFIVSMAFLLSLASCTATGNVNNTHAKARVKKTTSRHVTTKKAQSFPQRYTKQDKDGAPKGPLPSFFQSISPKNEALSRYGNPGSYSVEGRNYAVLNTSKGYKARGTASWYGTKFQKQRTSSGEHYDMYAMTAAHKTLPLPSYVRVKNLDNGREAIVKVNDRGPFHSSRVIDLSYAAATKIGLLPKGTAHVEVEALAGKTGKPYVARYYVQAGAFKSESLAHDLRRRLLKVTRTSIQIEKDQGTYIVRIGPYATQYMTVAMRKLLDKQGLRGAFSVLL